MMNVFGGESQRAAAGPAARKSGKWIIIELRVTNNGLGGRFHFIGSVSGGAPAPCYRRHTERCFEKKPALENRFTLHPECNCCVSV
ncbi:hypothetical protein EVAR_66966_1 [Eumeta japonica]|uniref:Uncharacterized protein n=1 Tax=Eumeta variegata TaxID=151549 RepID=A0A4C2A0Y5_EUMVA|nr:hypothetical protein EVAR_66966_1 [Eumeta japonica]